MGRFIAVFHLAISASMIAQSNSGLAVNTSVYDSGGVNAYSLAVADVNHDGKPDVLVANECVYVGNCNNGTLGVLLGNGDGTFRAAVTYSAGYFPEVLAVADLNLDGNLDVVLTGLNNAVTVLLGRGDGTFQNAVTYGSGGSYARSVTVADVNRDGKPDILVANYCSDAVCSSGQVGVLLGHGDGTFETAVGYSSGGYESASIVVADVNRDGKPDVIVTNVCLIATSCGGAIGGGVSVLLGNGDGSFQSALPFSSGGNSPYSVAVADVNGDGRLDLLVANLCLNLTDCSTGGSVGVLLGYGNGTFQAAVQYSSGAFYSTSVNTQDINRDGKLDLVISNKCASINSAGDCTSGGRVSVLLGTGKGTFQKAFTIGSGGNEALFAIAADVSGDAKPDGLVANFNSGNEGTVGVILNNLP